MAHHALKEYNIWNPTIEILAIEILTIEILTIETLTIEVLATIKTPVTIEIPATNKS